MFYKASSFNQTLCSWDIYENDIMYSSASIYDSCDDAKAYHDGVGDLNDDESCCSYLLHLNSIGIVSIFTFYVLHIFK